jgi:pyruvate kinase
LSKNAKIRTRAAPEFDLHRKLVINKQGMSNYDILTLQSETAKRHIEFAIKTEFQKLFLSMVARSAQSRVRFFIGTL